MPRFLRHVLLAAASAATVFIFFAALQSPDPRWRLSMGTAYASLVLLAVTLALGPVNRLRGVPNPVSTYLRRDIGIWAGILAIAHVVVGLQVHFSGRMWLYFVPEPPWRIPIRHDAFGLANWVGAAATVAIVVLLAISNDASIRKLGRDRWKGLQRWNYVACAMVAAHGALYMLIEKRTWAFVAAGLAVVLATMALQAAGYRATKRRA